MWRGKEGVWCVDRKKRGVVYVGEKKGYGV